jgi:hypothetical protein
MGIRAGVRSAAVCVVWRWGGPRERGRGCPHPVHRPMSFRRVTSGSARDQPTDRAESVRHRLADGMRTGTRWTESGPVDARTSGAAMARESMPERVPNRAHR